MVDVLMLCREHPLARVELAVRGALTAGAVDGRAVALLARQAERPTPAALQVEREARRESARRYRMTSPTTTGCARPAAHVEAAGEHDDERRQNHAQTAAWRP